MMGLKYSGWILDGCIQVHEAYALGHSHTNGERYGFWVLETSIRWVLEKRGFKMGEAKRRQDTLGQEYGKEQPIAPWFPVRRSQIQWFYKTTNRSAWIGIIALVIYWVTVRFIGPFLGWWEVQW